MKKKISLLLLSIFVLPLISLFGCEEILSYPVYVYSSSTIYGSVSGSGTYKEGNSVTLTANAKQGGHVIGWVYQGSQLLEDSDLYKIVAEESNSSQKVVKSSLTFTMSEKTQGKYTAVFDDSKMMYIKLSSFRITSTYDPENAGEEDSEKKEKIMTASSTNISQGSSSSNLTTVYTTDNDKDLDIKDNVNIIPNKVDKVLKLSTTTSQYVKVSTQLNYKNKNMSLNFRADVDFATSTNKDSSTPENNWIDNTNYSYRIDYSQGTYDIVFKFQVAEGEFYHLVLTYKNLSA